MTKILKFKEDQLIKEDQLNVKKTYMSKMTNDISTMFLSKPFWET